MTCPPSPGIAITSPVPRTGISEATPRPVPGPTSAMGFTSNRGTTANPVQLIGCQSGQRQRQCQKIIQHQQLVQVQAVLERIDRKSPMVVGHADMVTHDRRRNANGAAAWLRQLFLPQMVNDGVPQRLEICTGVGVDFGNTAARFKLATEAHIGAAHVGEQPWKAVGIHARRSASGVWLALKPAMKFRYQCALSLARRSWFA